MYKKNQLCHSAFYNKSWYTSRTVYIIVNADLGDNFATEERWSVESTF